jgi:DNA (cytosine-5)-methyltransferase 1
MDLEIARAVPPGGNWRQVPSTVQSRRLEQIRVSAAEGQGSRSTYYGRLQWDRPAYTISTYFSRPGNGCFIHPSADRLITIREAARLQSFPDSYRFHGSARERQIQVGNAVPPLLAYQLGACFPRGRYVDIFCGAGGLSIGLEWAGFECVAAVDNSKSAIETFTANHNSDGLVIQADLADKTSFRKTVTDIVSRLSRSKLDLLVGGPPCQGFSTAGNNIADDPRNQLVWAFVSLVEKLTPRVVLMENVPALSWKRACGTLTRIRQRLEVLGYHSSMIVAHAEGYGVPQLRRRLFLMALKDPKIAKWPLPPFDILEPSYRQHQPKAVLSCLPPLTVRDAIGDLPLLPSSSLNELTNYSGRPTSEYQRWVRGEGTLSDIIPAKGNIPALPEPGLLFN